MALDQSRIWCDIRLLIPSDTVALPSALSSKALQRSAAAERELLVCFVCLFCLLLFICRLFIDSFDEFYFVSVEFE